MLVAEVVVGGAREDHVVPGVGHLRLVAVVSPPAAADLLRRGLVYVRKKRRKSKVVT